MLRLSAYYNEHDPFAGSWLRELIKAGLITNGDVDERSIVDVRADDLRGYDQCHFFAGIGGWSHALRLAGWPDDRPIWTGSCPCQPFSAAGSGAGIADARHLWPHFFRLIRECRPATVIGEQVGGTPGWSWLDHVFTDLEDCAYACAAADFPAASVGAPHIRQRLYWVANSEHAKRWSQRGPIEDERYRNDGGWQEAHSFTGACGAVCELAHADGRHAGAERQQCCGEQRLLAGGGGSCTVGDSNCERENTFKGIFERENAECARIGDMGHASSARLEERPSLGRYHEAQEQAAERAGGPVGGFWSNAEWIACRDGKARAVEPGVEPLAHGVPARVGRLRGYGNAIAPPQAAAFIEAFMSL